MLHPRISVVIPARNEAGTIEPIVREVVALAVIDEVIVVDDGSTDQTAAIARRAGARVVPARHGPGKGAAMRDGVAAATGAVVVFCDADLEGFDPAFVSKLVSALVERGEAVAMVKADYVRAGEGGRVTELVSRPILELLHPHVAHIAQPLGGEYAAWRSVLERVPFARGYGVEVGLLLDVARLFGPGSIGQVHLGMRRHRNRTLAELGPQAKEVLAVALERAGVDVTIDELPPLTAARPDPLHPQHSA